MVVEDSGAYHSLMSDVYNYNNAAKCWLCVGVERQGVNEEEQGIGT